MDNIMKCCGNAESEGHKGNCWFDAKSDVVKNANLLTMSTEAYEFLTGNPAPAPAPADDPHDPFEPPTPKQPNDPYKD